MAKGHRQGGKIKGRHTTVIPVAEKLIDSLERCVAVQKISVGFIKQGIKSGRHAVKITEMESGLLLKVRGTASIQEIRIYTNQKDEVQRVLKQYANKKHLQITVSDD